MKLKSKTLFLVASLACLILLTAENSSAQIRDRQNAARGESSNDSDNFLRTAGLKPGDKLPDVEGYDINGKPFALRDIKGSYAVIVCGCMT